MHHWCKSGVNLHSDILALKSNRVTNLVAIDMNTDKRRVDQLHFNIFVARLKCNLPLRLHLGALLYLLDDKFHLSDIERTIRLRTTIANRVRHTLH
ncbi:hypothetical protein D9M68_791170 [compost metagenome]